MLELLDKLTPLEIVKLLREWSHRYDNNDDWQYLEIYYALSFAADDLESNLGLGPKTFS